MTTRPTRPAPPPAGIAAAAAENAAIPPRPEQRPLPTRKELVTAARAKAGKPPKLGPSKRSRFTTRHSLVMYMDLAGERTVDIALKLGMHPNSVSALKSSQLYQFHRDELLSQLTERKFENLLDLIRSDSVKNAEFLISVRESNLEETKDRLGAARALQKEADRVYPRHTTKHVEERIVKVTIGAEKMARIANALREVEAIEAESIPLDDYDPTQPDDVPLIRAQSIDEARNELLDAAQSASSES